ncbi:MAG: RimK family alpha-L-glutamate ligase [Candidatus Aenigmarchaeota archaeon]|nr:RimK family alpha-L-glutamate ligase [Candidatus Aenigmarchaeota archaeon]
MLNKKLLIVAPSNYAKSTQMLVDEAKKVFSTVELVPINDISLKLDEKTWSMIYKDTNLAEFDYCLPRIDAKRALHGYHVIRFMDHLGIDKPYSAETILMAHNKFETLEQMKKAGVPIPTTYTAGSVTAAKDILKRMDYPVVIKVVDGFGGRGVVMVEDFESAQSVVETMKILKKEIIIEEFVGSGGEDIRAFIVGGEIVAGMKRKAKTGDFRSNLFSGGKATHFTVTGEFKDVALKAAAAAGSDIIAIDMIDSPDGPKVIEVNINPGIKGIQKVTNINVAGRIIEFIAKRLEK